MTPGSTIIGLVAGDIPRNSPRARRRRRRGMRHRRVKLPAAPKRSFELLPKAARKRTEIGHFELDAMAGRRGGAALQSKTCRHSRKVFLDIARNLETPTYSKVLTKRLIRDVPSEHLRAILQDNGAEHAKHEDSDAALGTKSFFCHPFCASERDTWENRDGFIRRVFPKGSHFDDRPREYVDWVEDRVNTRPMKVLNFRTPNEVWRDAL